MSECLSSLSSIRLMIPQKLTGSDEKRKCREQLKEIQRRYPDGLPLMDPIEDMHITGLFFTLFEVYTCTSLIGCLRNKVN